MKLFKKTYTFDKSEVFILFLLILFCSVLVFSVGVMIGKKMLENECKIMLEDLNNNLKACKSGEEIKTSFNSNINDDNKKTSKNQTNEETNEETNDNSKLIDNNNKDKVVKNTFSNNDNKKEIIEKKIINNTNVNENNNTSSLEINKITNDIKNKYTVQISAHKDEEDAISKTSSLYNDGYKSAYYMKADIKNKGVWYRVGIGFFPKKNSAELFAQMLKRQGKIESYIIRRIR